ncbi:Beta-1,4-galactosyltransferase 7 [Holothuria leucospilota]|uniref:Beta-1,4-galactosyltransferase n=1 Tax=Holothuria leucospilota TaxID=206669 RepID=A0A9Q1BI05_HOLLE|nr:Beta-1,4-galactosyltransferase 7 [Holothuria leucospilota]
MAQIRMKVSLTKLVAAFLLVVLVSMVMLATYNECDYTGMEQLTSHIRHLKDQIREQEMLLARVRQTGSESDHGLLPEKDPGDNENWGPHKLAILIPFRDRFEELMEFVPYMHKFLVRQKVRHRFYVINQMDHHRFNRASLINVGYIISRKDCDYIAMHDVDLLPRNNNLSYRYEVVENGPHHLASPALHPNYHYEKFVGGILLMQSQHFELVNGLSNTFWGWGREDDELYMRMEEAKLKISRPVGITTGYQSFFHIHDPTRRKRDRKRYGNQKLESFKRDTVTGVDTVLYEIRSTQELHIDGTPCTVLHVELECDVSVTPWCDPPPEPVRKPVPKKAR